MADNLNLVPERGPSVWDNPRPSAGEGPSTGALVGGAVMLAAGAAAAFFGGRTVYRAVRNAAERMAARFSDEDDIVDEGSADSFPASDAPSWTTEGATLDSRRRR